jgi:predicted amidophosphoribosyltransferase
MKRASEIFGSVDPHLKVIDGGTRRTQRSKQEDWEASGGAICPRCKNETVRFRPQDGVCRECAESLDEKHFEDEKKRAKQLRYVKAHNARIKKRGA